MQRETCTPRANWIADCEAVGFTYHSLDGTYWDESRRYRFTSDEIDLLEAATAELHARCLDAARHIVATDRLGALAIPPAWQPRVAQSLRLRLRVRPHVATTSAGPTTAIRTLGRPRSIHARRPY